MLSLILSFILLEFYFTGGLLPSLSMSLPENPGSRKYASMLRTLKAKNPEYKLEYIENWIMAS